MNYEDIGKFIKERRKNANLTQKELASRVGVTDKAVSKWETGRGIPDISMLETLAKELNCSIIEILKGKEILKDNINKDDLDSYIKEGLNYSQGKYKNIINKIISFLIIFIVVLVFILNIINIYNQHKKYYPTGIIPFGDLNEYHRYINEDIKNIKDLISKIKNNQGSYDDKEYGNIMRVISNIDKYINDDKFLTYNGEGYTLNEIYLNEYDLYYDSSIFSLASIMHNKDEKYQELAYALAYNSVNNHNSESYSLVYKYELYRPFIVKFYSQDYFDIITSKLHNRVECIKMLKYVLNEIVEVGDINE